MGGIPMKKKWRFTVGVLFILVGIGIVLIPFITQSKNAKVQKALLQKYDLLISDNISNLMSTMQPIEQEKEEVFVDFSEHTETTTDFSKYAQDNVKDIVSQQKIIGLISCDKLDMKLVVVEGANKENLRATIGHIEKTSAIGEEGNCVLAGHRGGYYGEFFQNIHMLAEGDIVTVTDIRNQSYQYKVYEQFVVEPTEVWICNPIEGEDTLTLLSCEDNGTRRIVVRCRKMSAN